MENTPTTEETAEQNPESKMTAEERERVEAELRAIEECTEEELRCLRSIIERNHGKMAIYGRTPRNEVDVVVNTHGVIVVHRLIPTLPKGRSRWGVAWEVQDSWAA